LLSDWGFGERFVPVNKFLIRCFSREGDPYSRVGRNRTILLLDKIRERCSKMDAELLVLIIPALVQVDREVFDAFSSRWARDDPDRFDRLLFHQTFISQLEEEAFCVVDMMDRLEAETAAGEPCYHAEGHWNAHGHALAAEELIPVLSDLLKGRAPR
jgi:hypothetical protein